MRLVLLQKKKKNRLEVMKKTGSGFLFNLLLEWRKTPGVKGSPEKEKYGRSSAVILFFLLNCTFDF